MAQKEYENDSLDKKSRDIDKSSTPGNETYSTYSDANGDHGADADVGYSLFIQAERERIADMDEKEWSARSRIVARKIDFHVLPILCIVYCLQYMDKQGLNYSNLFGFQQDLHLKGQQFSWVSSIFYFGYLISQYPLGWLIQKLPIGRFLGVTIFLWSVTLMSTAACTNFAGAMVNRFVLGCLEAAVTPSFVLITGMWYTASEQPFRQLTWYSFQAWANTIGGLIGYGVGHIKAGLQQWTYIYLILGGVTALFSIVVYFFLPDSPVTARFFNDTETLVAVKRVASNKTGIENKRFKRYQIVHALKDPKTYILFVLSFAAQIPNGLLTSFRSQIIQNLGFTVLQTTVLGIPSDAIQGVSLLLAGYVASRVKNTRILIMTIGNVTCIVAAACMAYLPLENHWGRLVAFWFTALQSIGFSLGLAMVSINIGGYTKKVFTGATMFVGYCVGNIIGPFFVYQNQAPRYISAIEAMLSGYVIKTAAGLLLGAYMVWDNRRRDRIQQTSGPAYNEHEGQRLSLLDKTEFVMQLIPDSTGSCTDAVKPALRRKIRISDILYEFVSVRWGHFVIRLCFEIHFYVHVVISILHRSNAFPVRLRRE